MRRDLPPSIAGPYWTGPSAREKLAHCRECLENADGLHDVEMSETIAPALTVEELIGAVLHAHDEFSDLEADRESLQWRVDELEADLAEERGTDGRGLDGNTDTADRSGCDQ